MRSALPLLALAGCNQLLGSSTAYHSPDANPTDLCAAMGLPPTSISGTVYAPNGTLPLPNAMVYLPTTDLDPIVEGVGPPACTSGSPSVIAKSDASGHFKLEGVPVGADVTLVVQIGKWRREHVTIPADTLVACGDTAVAAGQTTLPRQASEGSMPHVAITTGLADALECLARDIGVDPTEVTTGPASTGHFHLYADNGITTMMGGSKLDAASTLYAPGELAKYDLVMLGCPGSAVVRTAQDAANLHAWTMAGGWLFLTHYAYSWLTVGPAPWPTLATFPTSTNNTATVISVDTSTPIGQTFSDWATAIGVSTTPGQIPLQNSRNSCSAIDTSVATRRLYLDPALNAGASGIQTFTWDTTMNGRVTFDDVHIGSAPAATTTPYPAECTMEFKPQEDAVMFQLFETPTCAP